MKMMITTQKFYELIPDFLIFGFGPFLQRRRCLREQSFSQQWKADGKKWFSQNGQDEFIVNTMLQGQTGGFFIDIGANDGVTHSNTISLERFYSWTGLCVEPHPDIFLRLQSSRTCECINAAAMPEEGELEFWVLTGDEVDLTMLSGFRRFMTPFQVERIERNIQSGKAILNKRQVRAISIPDYVKREKMPIPDILCIDVEGAEWFIAKHILDSGIHPRVLCIENNGMHYKLVYELFRRGYHLSGIRGGDEIYLDNNQACPTQE